MGNEGGCKENIMTERYRIGQAQLSKKRAAAEPVGADNDLTFQLVKQIQTSLTA